MAAPPIAALSARIATLERKVLGHTRRRITRTEKARLMGVTPRTVARHVAAGLIEPPDIENGRWYFFIEEPAHGTADSSASKATRDPHRDAPA